MADSILCTKSAAHARFNWRLNSNFSYPSKIGEVDITFIIMYIRAVCDHYRGHYL